MSLFNFDQEQLFTFFAVLVRYSVMVAVLPFLGDRFIPAPVKVLLSLVISIALFPSLINRGLVHPGDAIVWASTAGGIITTIGLEVLVGLVFGFTAKLVFETISFAGNLIGSFMGFAAASMYDPHQESQSQVIAEFYMALAMLIFLALDGHHLMLRSALDSYRLVGVGKASFGAAMSERLLDLTGQVIRFGIQLAAPIAISIFAVNVAFGVLSKTMPQLNILVLSFAVTAIIGLVVMFVGLADFQGAAGNILARVGDWMDAVGQSIGSG